MRHKMLWAAVALMMMTACSSDNDETIVNPEDNEWTPISLTRAEQELVTSNNDFAFNLFRLAGPRKIWVEDPEKGIILSPISITYALGMDADGGASLGQADEGANSKQHLREQRLHAEPCFCRESQRLL